MIGTRRSALASIASGDLFVADTDFGGRVICLALLVTATGILAKDICRGGELVFGRTTGVAAWPDVHYRPQSVSTIVSIARLPRPMRDTLVRYDRRSGSRVPSLAGPALSKPEIRALSAVDRRDTTVRLPPIGKWAAARPARKCGLPRAQSPKVRGSPDVCSECGVDL
jgi:hypothetical protein